MLNPNFKTVLSAIDTDDESVMVNAIETHCDNARETLSEAQQALLKQIVLYRTGELNTRLDGALRDMVRHFTTNGLNTEGEGVVLGFNTIDTSARKVSYLILGIPDKAALILVSDNNLMKSQNNLTRCGFTVSDTWWFNNLARPVSKSQYASTTSSAKELITQFKRLVEGQKVNPNYKAAYVTPSPDYFFKQALKDKQDSK